MTQREEPLITVDLRGCARCHGDGHPAIVFRKLTHPVESAADAEEFTHWAPCPTNGEPILMLIKVAPETMTAKPRIYESDQRDG